MRPKHFIESHLREARAEEEELKAAIRAEIDAADRAIRKKYQPESDRIREIVADLARELLAAQAHYAAHPLEGRRVTRTVQVWSHNLRPKPKEQQQFGVVQVLRRMVDFPPKADHLVMGSAIVRRTDRNGNILKSYELLHGPELAYGWRLIDE